MKRKFLIALFCMLIAVFTLPAVVFAASETESNNTCATATSISVNQDVTGNISQNSDVDWYKFTTTSNGYVTIDFSHENLFDSTNKWGLSLYKSNGTTPAQGGDGWWVINGNSNLSTFQIGLPAGTYYIKIEPYDKYDSDEQSTATYTLRVNYTASSNYETEINNSAANADPISVNTNYNGATDKNDIDWYKFTTTSNGYVTLAFSHKNLLNSYNKWKLDLYKSDGTTQAEGGDGWWVINGNSNLSTYQIGLPAGTYYIKIEPYDNYDSDERSSATYTLRVNYTASSNYETEINNSASNADPISVNTNYNGATDRYDIDWYKFTTTSNGYVTIDFSHENLYDSNDKWGLSLYKSDGTTQAQGGDGWWTINGNSNLSTNQIGLPAGTYYIKIEPYDNYDSDERSCATYTLRVNYTASSNYETEKNNSASQADNISINTNYYGATFYNDVDWYSVDVTNPGYYQFKFSHSKLNSSDTYWYMYIYKSDGTTKVFSSDKFNISGNGTSYTTDETYLNSGKYFIKIAPYSTSRFSSSLYTIRVCNNGASQYTISYNANRGSGAPDSQIVEAGYSATISSIVPERFGYTFLGWSTSSSATSATYKSGDTITVTSDIPLYAVWKSADVISSNVTNSSYTAAIAASGDFKYFKFTPSATSKYRFESTGSSNPKIYLYDANGNQLASNDDGGENRNFLLDYKFNAGTTYYIKVNMYSTATGTVNFSVKRINDIAITTQPSTTYAKLNETANVTIAATGEGLTYAWYFKNPSSSSYTKSAITSATYSATMQKALSGRQVYCVVSDKYGNTVKSNTVYLYLTATITKQPTSATAAVGSTARVNITAVGDGLTYTWYFKNPGSSSFTKSGVTSSTYTMTMQPSLSGREVYCVVTDKYGNTEKSNTVKVKAPAVKITTQPKTTYAKLNGTASVTIAASGEGLKYAWYFKNPGNTTYTKSSVTSSTYSMTMLKSLSGRLVYCMVTDKYGNKVRSDTVSLNLAVTITKQPTNTTVPVGQSARVSITATGDGLKYAWYFKNPGSSSYTKSGVTSSTYTMTMQSSLSGRQVYCVVTDKYGKTAKSNTVKIKAPAVKITTQPKTTYAKLNGTINLSVAASGDGIKYAWYFKNPGNSTYTKSSITSSTYTMTMKESLSGRLVYCMVTDKYGNKVRSNTVNVCMQATITKQPASATVSAGKTATISITAAGEELRYAWYFKNPDSSSFTRSGVSTSTYTMTMQKSLSGRQVYCVVTDKYGKTAKSNTVTINVPPAAKITTQPKTTYAKVNETAKVTIAASGDGLKYTWYFKNPGSSTYTKSGITSSTYSVTMQNAVAGRKVYCVVSDKYGNSVKSNTITLCLTASITTQPKSAYAKAGDTAKISVAAAGDGLTYTWYFKNPGSSSYTKSGITASTYSVTMQSAISGRKVYCVVADKYGNSVKSDTVTLYINATITKQPTSTSAIAGSEATVSVTAAGNGLTYTWYFKNPGSSSYTKSSITSSTYTMTMQESLSGRKVYCVVTDKNGNSVRSNTVTLTTLTVTVKPVPGIDAVLK